MTTKKDQNIETKALIIGFFINLIMGLAGWYMYLQTNIDALFLDGNFSLISALGCVVAILISKFSDKKTQRFPDGMYFLEPLYGTLKSLLSFTLIVIAGFSAIVKLYNFFFLDQGEMLQMGGILYYSLAMTFLCFLMSWNFSFLNKKIENRSTMLTAESKASFVDGIISLVLGVVILFVTLLPKQGNTLFVYYIGDAVITLVMIAFIIKTPWEMLKESFIETMFGVIKPSKIQREIEQIINQKSDIYKNITIKNIQIYKTGKNMLVLIRIACEDKNESVQSLFNFKQEILQKIGEKYKKCEVEVGIE
ncbi:cation transporter [Candidatus Gracilibacteria bacterium]|nr:cation transporter [Candidatus Gracilibacteria bacterium]